MAAAGVSAGIGDALGGGLKPLSGKGSRRSFANIAAHTAVGAGSLLASAATRSAIEGSSFGKNIIAGLPDVIGQSVGRALGGALRGDDINRNPVQDGPPPVATISGGGGILAIATAISAAERPDPRLIIPEGDIILAPPATSAAEALERARQWDAVRDDPAYRDGAEHNAQVYRNIAADFVQTDMSAIAASVLADAGDVVADIGAGLQNAFAGLSDRSLAGISDLRASYQASSEAHKEAYPYDPTVYGRDIMVGLLSSASSAVASVPGFIVHPVDRGLAPIARSLDSVFLDNRNISQVASDTRTSISRMSSTQLAMAGGDTAFAVGSALTPARATALSRAGSYSGRVYDIASVHKNSLSYVGDTHVYAIRSADGRIVKIGESAQGVRRGDGASIRGEAQARALRKETGARHFSDIRANFGNKADARAYETRYIDTFRKIYGDDALPLNKTNR